MLALIKRNLIEGEFWLSVAVVGGLMVCLPIVFHCL